MREVEMDERSNDKEEHLSLFSESLSVNVYYNSLNRKNLSVVSHILKERFLIRVGFLLLGAEWHACWVRTEALRKHVYNSYEWEVQAVYSLNLWTHRCLRDQKSVITIESYWEQLRRGQKKERSTSVKVYACCFGSVCESYLYNRWKKAVYQIFRLGTRMYLCLSDCRDDYLF